MKTLFALSFLLLVACGGGSNTPPPVETPTPEPPPVVVEPEQPEEPIHPEEGTVFEAYCEGIDFVSIEADGNGGQTEVRETDAITCGYMPECPVDATGDDNDYPFVNCNGITQAVDTPFRYTDESSFVFEIDILFVVDTRLDTKGKTLEEFVQAEIDYSNQIFQNTNVYIKLNIADIQTVETSDHGLRKQIDYFTTDRYEYRDVSTWQKEANADLAYLFLQRPNNPIACGVAYLNASVQNLKRRRGATQCFQGDIFQENDNIRYYNRAHETFTHEVGHSLGLEHDKKYANGTGIFPFSFGYVLPNTERIIDNLQYNGIGTIMSYADEPTQSFSDPNKYYTKEDGTTVPTGNTNTNATKHLNIVRHTMSQLNEKEEYLFFIENHNNNLSVITEDASILCVF